MKMINEVRAKKESTPDERLRQRPEGAEGRPSMRVFKAIV
jgi:hypothetical protein